MAATAGKIKAGAAYIELSVATGKIAQGLRKAQTQIRTFGQSLKGVGADLMQVAGTISIPIAMAVRRFAAFDQQLRVLGVLSQSTGKELVSLQNLILSLSKKTFFSKENLADAAIEIAKIGIVGRDIAPTLKNMSNLMSAAQVESHRLGEMTEYTLSILKQFNLPVSKIARITDVMAMAANESAAGIDDMTEAMKIAGPSANSVNETVEDTAAALMLLANAGIKGSLAGTSLRKIYQSLAVQSGKTKGLSAEEIAEGMRGTEQLVEMGIQIVDPQTGNLRKAGDIMADLAQKVKKMRSGEKINFATDVFDLRGSLGALSMLNNSADLKVFRKNLQNAGGYAQRVATQINQGPLIQLHKIVESLKQMGDVIGQAVAQIFGPLLQKLPQVINGITKFMQEHQKMIGIIAVSIGVIAALGVVLFGLGAIIKIISFGLGGIILAFTLLTKVILLPIALVKGFIAVFALLKTVIIGVKVAFAALVSPIGLIVLALSSAIAIIGHLSGAWQMLGKACSQIGNDFATAFSAIKETFSNAFGAIKTALASGDLAGAARVGLAALALAWEQFMFPLRKIWGDLKSYLLDSWEVITHTLAVGASQAFYGVIFAFKWLWKQILQIWYPLTMALEFAWIETTNAIAKAANDLWYGLRFGLKATGNWLANLWDDIWGGIVDGFYKSIAELKKAWYKTRAFVEGWDKITLETFIIETDKEYRNGRAKRRSIRARDKDKRKEELDKLELEWDSANKNLETSKEAEHEKNFQEYNKKMAEASKPIDTSEWDAQIKSLNDAHHAALAQNSHAAKDQVNQYAKRIAEKKEELDSAIFYVNQPAILRKNAQSMLNAARKKWQKYYANNNPDEVKNILSAMNENPRKSVQYLRKEIARLQKIADTQKGKFDDYNIKASADRVWTHDEKANLQVFADVWGKTKAKIERYSELLKRAQSKVSDNMEDSGFNQQQAIRSNAKDGRDAVGAWSLKALSGLVGGSVAERTAKATERNVYLQKENKKILSNISSKMDNIETRYN